MSKNNANIEVSLEQWAYISTNVVPMLPTDEQGAISRSIQNVKIEVWIDRATAESLIDACGSRLMKVGLRQDHEANEEGRFIEALIDTISNCISID